jgi:hypothetical protein
MIPLVAYLIYSVGQKKLRNLGMWFVPVILLPLIWPAYSASQNQFDYWTRDVLWQTQRQSAGFASIIASFAYSDPVGFIMGFSGLAYAVIRKDIFLLFWLLPFIAFLSVVGYVQYFYWVPLLPAFFIAAAAAIEKLVTLKPKLLYPAIAGITIFGLLSTFSFITTDMTSAQFNAAAFLSDSIVDDVTIAASPNYSWMLIYVFEIDHVFRDYRDLLFYPVETERLILVADRHLETNLNAGTGILEAYENSEVIARFESEVNEFDITKYPHTNLAWNFEGSLIEIRERK